MKGAQQTGTKDIRSCFVFGQSREAPKATVTEQTGQRFPKRHKATGEPAKQMPSLKGLCWNVRGLTTVLHELTHLVEQQAPDFIVLTETKLRKNSRYRKKLTEALEDYVVHTSCKRDIPNMREGERTGAAGVANPQEAGCTWLTKGDPAECPSSQRPLPKNLPATSRQ